MRVRWQIATVLVVLVMFGAGMAWAAGAGEEEAPAVEPPETLTAVGHGVHEQAAEGLLEEFFEQTGIQRVEWQTFGIGDIHSTIMRQAALPTAPFDVGYVFTNELDPRLLSRLEPLDRWLEESQIDGFPEDFSEGMLDAVTHEGELRAIPMRGVVDAVHRNMAIFDERDVAPPETIEEFVDAARELTFTRDDGSRVYGYSAQGTPDNIAGQVINFSRAMYPDEDAGVITPDFRVVIDQEPAIEAIELLRDLYQEGVLHPDISTHTVDDVTRLYESGRLAMWMGNITNYENFNDPERAVDAGQSEVMPLPFTEAYGGDRPGYATTVFWSFAIPGNTENTEYAWEFIRHLSSYESQLHAGLHNANQPTRTSVLESEEYIESVPYAAMAAQLSEASQVGWPAFAALPEAQEIAGEEIIRAMHGEISPREAAENAASDLRDLLREQDLLAE